MISWAESDGTSYRRCQFIPISINFYHLSAQFRVAVATWKQTASKNVRRGGDWSTRAIVENPIMISAKVAMRRQRSKSDIWLACAFFLHLRGSSVHYHLQCTLFVYTREILVPLTLYDGVQRESRTRDNVRCSLSRAIQNILKCRA